MEGTASEGAEYEGVMSMEKAYAEDCADFASCNVEGLLRHVSFSSELYGISSVEIQGGTGYHGNIVWVLHHRAVCPLTEYGDTRRIYCTVSRCYRVVVSGNEKVSIFGRAASMEGIDRTGQSTSAADGLFLGPGTILNSTAGMSATGKVEKKRVISFGDKAFCRYETIIVLDKHSGLSCHVRCRNRRNLLLLASASFEHVGEIELDGSSGWCRIFSAADAVCGLTKDGGVLLFALLDS